VFVMLNDGPYEGGPEASSNLHDARAVYIFSQVPGMTIALQKLQKSADDETQQRASLALNLLAEHQQQHGPLFVLLLGI